MTINFSIGNIVRVKDSVLANLAAALQAVNDPIQQGTIYALSSLGQGNCTISDMGSQTLSLTTSNGSTIAASYLTVVPVDQTNQSYNGGLGVVITFTSDAQINMVFELASILAGGSTTMNRTLGDENTVLVDCTLGTITLILPAASGAPIDKTYWIQKIDATNNALRVNPTGTDTISGAASLQTTTQYGSFRIRVGNSNWWSF